MYVDGVEKKGEDRDKDEEKKLWSWVRVYNNERGAYERKRNNVISVFSMPCQTFGPLFFNILILMLLETVTFVKTPFESFYKYINFAMPNFILTQQNLL